MRRVAVVVTFTALALGGCMRGGLPPERVQAWVGRSAADLTREWGTPTREADDGGKRILIYDEIEQAHGTEFQKQVTARQAGTADAAAAANAAVQGGKTYARSYLFWLDDAGKITQAQIRQR
jgi:hypothetical protein